jgi:hypothetical protein
VTIPLVILIVAPESHLEGVNRRNLKFINFEHTLILEVRVINEFGVRKIVPLAMSCSINANNLGSNSNQDEQGNFREGGEGRNKSSEYQHKNTTICLSRFGSKEPSPH